MSRTLPSYNPPPMLKRSRLPDWEKKAQRTSLKTPTMRESAQLLGFDSPKAMYPDYPMEQAPELWMITKEKGNYKSTYQTREILKELSLNKPGDISIQINAPRMNDLLWQIKAQVTICPIRFPDGLPTAENLGYTELKRNGEFIIKKTLRPKIAAESMPLPEVEDYKIVDGYRTCTNCRDKRCSLLSMCQKLYDQQKKNKLEQIAPRLFNWVDNPEKKASKKEQN